MNAESPFAGESQRAANELDDSQQRYRRLIEAVTDYIFTVRIDNGGAVETVHGPNCVAVTGYTPEEFVANPMLWIAMVPEQDRHAVEQQAARVLSGQDAPPIEHRILRKDGAMRWVLNTCVAYYDEQGKLLSYDGVIRDVTERKEVEFKLHQLNETLEQRVAQRTAELESAIHTLRQTQFTIDHSQDAIFWLRPDGGLLFVNDAACQLSGYGREELLSKTVYDFDPELTHDQWPEWWERFKTASALVIERRLRCKQGHEIPVDVSPNYLKYGQQEFLCTFVRNISDRKRSEEALRASEERLRAILNTAADAIINIDAGGTIQAVNPATEQMFGYTEQELVGQNVNVLMPSPYREEHDRYVARYLETGQARIIGIGREVVALRKDGSTLPIDLAVSEVKELGLFTGVIRDLTDRRRLQRQVLDIAVEEQTRIGQDLHDGVGQELTAVNYMTQNLLACLPEDCGPASAFAQKITNGLKTTQQRLRDLVKGFMPVDVSVQGLPAALQDLIKRTNETQQREVCFLICSQDVPVIDTSTATHLYRIAQEAVSNALKHAKTHRIDVSLHFEPARLTLEIRDHGVGINAVSAEPEGIGLRIMQYRASLIGGRLELVSGSNGGTVVRCELYDLRSFSDHPAS